MMKRKLNLRHVALIFGLVASVAVVDSAYAQVSAACGSFDNAYGPFDYRTDKNMLGRVEEYHFTPEIEAVIQGKATSTKSIDGDLRYTLGAFPNHHRALVSMIRLREKTPKPPTDLESVECYFDRAIRFRPDDVVVRLLFASYLITKDRKDEAIRHLEIANVNAKDNPFTQHNIGLVYFDLKEYDKALNHAHRAASLGYTHNALSEQLQSVGKWVAPK